MQIVLPCVVCKKATVRISVHKIGVNDRSAFLEGMHIDEPNKAALLGALDFCFIGALQSQVRSGRVFRCAAELQAGRL
jgi:hypothetical protein